MPENEARKVCEIFHKFEGLCSSSAEARGPFVKYVTNELSQNP